MTCTIVLIFLATFRSATATRLRAPSKGAGLSLVDDAKVNGTKSAKVRAGAAEAALDQRVYEELKKRSDCGVSNVQSKAPSARCKELCEGSSGCQAVCDEVRAMLCSPQDNQVVAVVGGQSASEVAAAAATAATNAVREAVKDAVSEVAKTAVAASAQAQAQVKLAAQQASGIAKQAAKESAQAAAAAAAQSAAKEAAQSAHVVASTAAAASIAQAKGFVPAKAPAAGAKAPAPGPGPAPAPAGF